MRNGEEDPSYTYQDRRNFSGRRTTTNTIHEEALGSSYPCHWLFRKRGRGKRGVTLAVTSFVVSVVILNGISTVYYQHSKMMRLLLLTSTTTMTQKNSHHHRNLNNEYETDAPPTPHHPRFRLTHTDNNNDSIATTTDRNTHTNMIQERMISPRNSNKISTLKTTDTDTDTDTDDTTATSPILTGNTTVRPIATTSVIRTGNTITTITTSTTSTRTSANLPPPCDWLDDIDTYNTTDVFQCGAKKCAFHSISSRRRRRHRRSGGDSDNNNSSSPPLMRYGYLVSDEGNKTFHQHQQGFGFAQHLTAMFAIRHTLLAPPRRTDDSTTEDCDARRIDQNVTDQLNGATVVNKYRKTFQPDRPLILQPIELLPAGSILFKCDQFWYRKAHKNLLSMSGDWTATTTTTQLGHDDDDFHAWEDRMRRDLNLTQAMLASKVGACLEKDFQVVFDTSQGGIIHIDLDRCFEREKRKRKKKWKKECQKKLISFTEQIIQLKRPT